MSNPVASPPPAGDGFPPPVSEGAGAPVPNQPFGAPAEGQPVGDPAQQGFGTPATFPVEPEKKKSTAANLALRIVGIIVVAVIIFVGKTYLFGDKAKDAAVGDCVASSQDVKVDEETEAQAEVVDCASKEAAFTVVGRVEGETNTDSKSCEKYFKENEEYYVYSSTAGGGYLLCLRPKA
ncbi:hypothetical protein ACIBSW_32985 [Actinoplanes sp. NPDC049668]|uniref:LppU/SCO3897 family protein n=1 Tax=unclassified Actinoplanes TaxID=2626549 RepID=UPI0033B1176F